MKSKNETSEINHIEGKFGKGKNGITLNEIRAKFLNTSENGVACINFVMDFLQFEKVNIFCPLI